MEKLLALVPDLTIVASSTAISFLKNICNTDFRNQTAIPGKSLELGGKTLTFISALLLHWPDALYTYLQEDKVLFSCDSFGSHYASGKLFNDLIDEDLTPSFKYYFDSIMGPFKPHVLEALDKLSAFEIDIIHAIDQCPSGALKYAIPEGSKINKGLAKGPGSFPIME